MFALIAMASFGLEIGMRLQMNLGVTTTIPAANRLALLH
jgi:hypothetical protein